MEAMQPRFVFGCLSLPLPFLLRPQSNLRVFDSSKVTNDGRGLKKVTFKQSAGQWGGWLNAKSLSGKLMMQHYKTTGQDKKMKCRMSHLYYNQPMSVSATHSSWFCIDIHIFWSGIPYKITSLCCWIPFFLRGGGHSNFPARRRGGVVPPFRWIWIYWDHSAAIRSGTPLC